MRIRKTPEEKLKSNYGEACFRGYCPSLKERENLRIKELSNRLKATSYKETLTNVLDWQNRNVNFWTERMHLFTAIWSLILGIVAVSPLFISYRSIWFWCSTVLLLVLATFLLIAVYTVHSIRKLPLKQLVNMLLPSMSIDSILDNKLCVCRDYAKLTATLLFNIYPEKEIYFVHARDHVATGIKVEKQLYVLDKYLPLATIDKWHDKWNKSWFSPKKVEKVKGSYIETVKLPSLLSNKSSSKLDVAVIENNLERLLNVQRSMEDVKGNSIKLLQWKKGVFLYDDEELVNYSLSQRLKTVISKEMIDVSNVKHLVVDRKKNDLIFRVEL
jgi:predicted transglutaminase-like protease